MRHEYVDIPAQPQPLQEYFWQRQELALEIKEASDELNEAYTRYNALIGAMIQMNDRIREAENQ